MPSITWIYAAILISLMSLVHANSEDARPATVEWGKMYQLSNKRRGDCVKQDIGASVVSNAPCAKDDTVQWWFFDDIPGDDRHYAVRNYESNECLTNQCGLVSPPCIMVTQCDSTNDRQKWSSPQENGDYFLLDSVSPSVGCFFNDAGGALNTYNCNLAAYSGQNWMAIETRARECADQGHSFTTMPHECMCVAGGCGGAYCNGIVKVASVLEEDPTNYCPEDETCCCSCSSC
eukprot:403549_1